MSLNTEHCAPKPPCPPSLLLLPSKPPYCCALCSVIEHITIDLGLVADGEKEFFLPLLAATNAGEKDAKALQSLSS